MAINNPFATGSYKPTNPLAKYIPKKKTNTFLPEGTPANFGQAGSPVLYGSPVTNQYTSGQSVASPLAPNATRQTTQPTTQPTTLPKTTQLNTLGGLTDNEQQRPKLTQPVITKPTTLPELPKTEPKTTPLTQTGEQPISERKMAQNRILGLLRPTQNEQDLQQKINALISSSELGVENLRGQGRGIAAPILRGQAEKLQAQTALAAAPLQRQLALEQGVRTAELGAAEKMLEFLPEENAIEPVKISAGEQLVNPVTGEVVFTAPEKALTGPASYQEWTLAGGQEGTGMSYLEYLQDADSGSAPNSYKEWELAGGINTGMTYGDWLLEKNQKAPTQGQYAAAQYASRIQSSNTIIDDLEEQFIGKFQPGKVLPEALKSEDRKLIEQAQRNFINAVLRRESGAAIAPSEFESAAKQYFPQPGDTEKVLKQKRENRRIVEQNMVNEAGKAFIEPTLTSLEVNNQISTQIQDARNNNYSDDEIVGYIEKNNPELQTKIQEARNNNYSSAEILDYLSSFNKVGSDTQKIAESIGQFESGGDYNAKGPIVPTGQYAGDRAYGKYQIMGNNIPSWSQEALGYPITKEQFLANPQLQDKIAQHKINNIYNQYGNIEDVASVWFSGQPLARAGNRQDVLGTSVPQYVKNVRSIYNNLG